MTILVSLPSRPPSPVSFRPPVRARSVSSRSSRSSAADSSAPAWLPFSVTSVIWCLLRLGGYTVEITVPSSVRFPERPVQVHLGPSSTPLRFRREGGQTVQIVGSESYRAVIVLAVWALGEPLQRTDWPVKTRWSLQPSSSVTVSVIV